MVRKIMFLLIVLLMCGSAAALKNPSAVYCKELGYEYKILEEDAGQRGICVMPDGSEEDAWKFLRGNTDKTEYTYCGVSGYELKTVRGKGCESIYSSDCAVCVVDGEMVEVTELMKLSFLETTCGDGICGVPEDHDSCPEDCAVGQPGGPDEDNGWYWWAIGFGGLAVLGLILYLVGRTGKRKTKKK